METFWYWLTQVHLENGRENGDFSILVLQVIILSYLGGLEAKLVT